MNRGRRLAAVAGTLGLGIAGVLFAGAGAASANTIGGGGDQDFCGEELCLYYYDNGAGAMWYSDATQWNDLAGQTFIEGPTTTGDDGVGSQVKNHAQSAATTSSTGIYIYYNSEAYGWGAYDYLLPDDAGNLVTTWNNEASYSVNNYG